MKANFRGAPGLSTPAPCYQALLSSSNEARCRRVRAQAAPATQALSLVTGACCLPHPEKLATGGEDAYFVSEARAAIGIADGVGGWRESGIDPGDYSRNFMRTSSEYFETGELDRVPSDNKAWEDVVREALAVAHQKTRMPGSCTACVLALNAEGRFLSAANLGDSGFIVVRNGTAVFQTPPLQHFFDCPLQFGAYPEYVEATDYPSDAKTYTLNVMAGDVIVMGTDGLWDNCPLEEVIQLLPDGDESVDAAAELIATAAREHADDPNFESPYVVTARSEGIDLPWWEKVLNTKISDGKVQLGKLTGGKLDDITVLVARVSDAPRTRAGQEGDDSPSSSSSQEE